MNQKIASLSKEQEQHLKKMESELGCVLVAYEDNNKSEKQAFH
jgi:hypothetical protein